MPRPIKEGLDYFELDCQMNDKIKLIQAEFGLKGFAIVKEEIRMIYDDISSEYEQVRFDIVNYVLDILLDNKKKYELRIDGEIGNEDNRYINGIK